MQLGELLQAMLAVGGPKQVQSFGGLGPNRPTGPIHQAVQKRGQGTWANGGIGPEVVLQFGQKRRVVAAALGREQVGKELKGFGLLHLLQTQTHKISNGKEQGRLALEITHDGFNKAHGLDFFGIHRIGFKKPVVFDNHVGQDRVMNEGGIAQVRHLEVGADAKLRAHFFGVLAQKRGFGPQKPQTGPGLGVVDACQQVLVFLLQKEDLLLGRAMQFVGIGKFTAQADQQLPAGTQAQKALPSLAVGLPGISPPNVHRIRSQSHKVHRLPVP